MLLRNAGRHRRRSKRLRYRRNYATGRELADVDEPSLATGLGTVLKSTQICAIEKQPLPGDGPGSPFRSLLCGPTVRLWTPRVPRSMIESFPLLSECPSNDLA
jgi:hypothetical protein